MIRLHRLPGSSFSKGFSLIELMVALTIGLVIVVAAMSAYLGAAGAGKMSEAQSRMNEDAQAALAILTQQIRMAGDNPSQPNRSQESSKNPIYLPTPTFSVPLPTTTFSPFSATTPTSFALANYSILGCDGTFGNITSTTAKLDTLDTSTCATGTSTLPDSIAINYEADTANTIPTISPITPTDCLGNGLTTITATLPTVNTSTGTLTTATISYYVAENRFYIGTSTTIVTPSLYCKGNGGSGTQQPLVENIEDMQLTYGTAQPTSATVAGYLRADQVTAMASTIPSPNNNVQSAWKKVLTVRVCLIVRSENPVVSDAASAKYYNCANPPVLTVAPDLRLRRAYSTTVVLRNRMH